MATGALYGIISNIATGDPIPTATVSVHLFGGQVIKANVYPDGTYLLNCPPGAGYTVSSDAPNYKCEVFQNVAVNANTFTFFPIDLTPVHTRMGADAHGNITPTPTTPPAPKPHYRKPKKPDLKELLARSDKMPKPR